MKKILVVCALCISVCQNEAASSQDGGKPKGNQKPTNSYQTSQKQPEYTQSVQQVPQPQPHQLYSPYHFVPKSPVLIPNQQPTAMLIIAQPAYIPQHMLYNSNNNAPVANPTQQLLNYFHSNPQARYQLLHGYQNPGAQHQYVVNPNAIPSPANYQILAAPQYSYPQYVPAPAHYNFGHSSPLSSPQIAGHYAGGQHPMQLTDIAQLAQLAANNVASGHLRSIPPIITGFENFTPEQQTQIKAQLNAQFGGHSGSSTTQQPSQPQASAQYATRYSSNNNNQNDFVPSTQVKTEAPATSTSYNPTDIYRNQFTKG